MKDIERTFNLIKKYGIGLTLLVYFLFQHYSTVKSNRDIIENYQSTLKDNVVMLIRIDEKFKEVEELKKEVKEIRYEQRRLNDFLSLPSKRYNNE